MAVAACVAGVVSVGRAQETATRPATQPAAANEASLGYGQESYRLVEQPDEIVSVLKNGLTVIVKRVPGPVVAVRGYVAAGGIYEGQWLGGGLSHLLEHLVAGGSSERRTEAENRNLLQQIGNNSNAYTSADHTAYFVNTTPEHLEQAVDLVTGWMLGAKITPAEYKREYQVVQRELEMGKGEPSRQFWYLTNLNRYRVSPARVPVIGYQEVIQGLSRDDVYAYYKKAYQPNNMVFAVAGDLDPEVMLRAVQQNVSDAKPGRVFSHDIAQEPPVLSPRTLVATFPKLGQAREQLAFPTIKLSDPDLYALDLLSAVLSSGESSLLVEEIRDKRHLVSGIDSSSFTPDYVTGSFAITLSLDPARLAEATKAMLAVLEHVKTDGVDAGRIQRAKTQMKLDRVRSLQTAAQIASSLAGDYLSTGDPHFSDRYLQRIDAVTAEQLQAVARKYFDPQKLITTALLPAEYVGAKGLPRAEDLIRPVAPTTQATRPAAPEQITRVELDNGTILLLKRITTTPLVTVNMYSLGGLTAEDAATNGLGNLAMDLLPRGTQSRSAEQIAEFFDSIGGDLSTNCGNNTWYWNASFLKQDMDKAMAVYADVVNHPAFPEAELQPMKQRILAAIAGQDANWTAQAFRYFKQQYFAPLQSPYQWLSIGTSQNVTGFTRQQVMDWYQKKVLTQPRVLAIFGDIDLEQARALAAKYLGGGPKLPAPPAHASTMKGTEQAATPASQPAVAAINVMRVQVHKTQQPLAGVVIGFKSDSVIGGPASFPITVADTMASGYDYPTGYLHEVLRGRGLVYVVQAQNWPGRSAALPGTFLVYAGCDPKNVNEVVRLILENIARLQGSAADVQATWFDRSKRLITTADAMDHETAPAQASEAALDELFGLGYDYHAHFADHINAVSLEQVKQVATSRLRDCVVTVSTPLPQAVEVKTGRRVYDSFPPVDLAPRGVQHDTEGTK
jgi:zinc protease